MKRQPSLLEQTTELLLRDKRNLMQLSKLSGVSYFWLRRFKYGLAKNPRIGNVQALYDALRL